MTGDKHRRDISAAAVLTGGLIATCMYGGELVGFTGGKDVPEFIEVVEIAGGAIFALGVIGLIGYKLGQHFYGPDK